MKLKFIFRHLHLKLVFMDRMGNLRPGLWTINANCFLVLEEKMNPRGYKIENGHQVWSVMSWYRCESY